MTARVEGGDLVQIYRVAGLLAAQVLKGRLESLGIPVLLNYESLGPVMGLTIDGLGEVRVLVPADLAEEARQVIFDLEDDYVLEEDWS